MHRHLSFLLALSLVAIPCFGAITGVVMTGDGQPIAGARVSLRAFESLEAARTRLLSASSDAVPLVSAQTDSKGTFSLESPKEPTLDLLISARGYVPLHRRVERDEEIGALVLSKSEMRKASVTAAGKPVANALVVLYYGGHEYATRTDEQGRYEAADPKRASSISVIHPDYAVHYETFVTMSGVNASALNRTLAPGATFRGTVVSGDKSLPVAKAQIFVDGWPVATSGDDGTFTIAHMPLKWSTLTARKDTLLGQRAFSKEASATIRIASAATIGGRLTDAKTRMPIAGAVVRTSVRRFGPGSLDSAINTITDAKGMYSATVAPGTYTVFASHPGYDARPLDVSAIAGQHTAKDISLHAVGRVSGVVLDEEKRPVVVALLGAETPENSRFGMPRMMRGSESAVSGPDGRFTIRVQPDEQQIVSASKRGFPVGKTEAMAVGSGERKSGVVITIPTGIAVSGRAIDGSGNPLSGVAVTSSQVEGGPRGMMMRTFIGGMPESDEDIVHTASDGTFTTRVKEGTYDFTFRRDGFAPTVVRGQNVSVTTSPTIEAKLEPAVEIRGRVVRNGAGVENVMVMALSPGIPAANATTGPDGSFTLGNLAPGSLRLMARKEDDFIQEQRNVTAPTSDLVIEIRPGGRVSGRVVEKGSGKPVTAFQAGITTSRGSMGGGMVMMGPPQLRSFTSDDGSFTLESVPAGAMVVMASAPDYASARLNVNVEDGKEVTGIELQLDLGVKLTGRVTGPNGAAVSDAQVRILPSPTGTFASSGSERSSTTDANGEYTIDGLEAGEEAVSVSHPKYSSARKTVTLKGRETKLDVQLTSGGKISGTVVTESGSPVADAQVEAMSGGNMETARTNASGAFELDSVTPGRYRFTASKTGLVDGVLEDVDVTSGAPVRIVMKSGGTIYGRVSGLSPAELAQTQVMAGASQSMATGTVDAQGNYRIEGVAAGTIQVQAWTGSGFSGSSRRAPSQTVELAPGGTQQVDLAFSGDVVISGRVTRNGTPLAGGQVTFFPRGDSTRGSGSSAIDSEGRYSATGLQDGDYNVMISDTQRGATPYNTTYTVRGTANWDIDYKTNSLRGRVIDRATNEPLANVTVALRPASGSVTDGPRFLRSGFSDATGGFLIDAVPAGNYTATATRDGFANETKDLYVTDGATPDLEFTLARNVGVTLTVVDARDNRVITARATAFDMQGRVVDETRMVFTGGGMDAGNLTLNLAPGTYNATIIANGYAPQHVQLQSPSTPTIRMTPGGTIELRSTQSKVMRVRLIDASGAAYPRYSAAIPSRELLPGTNTFTNIAPGTYTLQLLDREVVVSTKRVTVQEGQTVTEEM